MDGWGIYRNISLPLHFNFQAKDDSWRHSVESRGSSHVPYRNTDSILSAQVTAPRATLWLWAADTPRSPMKSFNVTKNLPRNAC